MNVLMWETIEAHLGKLLRTKVPGGWLVYLETKTGVALTFYPDPKHEWDGGSSSK